MKKVISIFCFFIFSLSSQALTYTSKIKYLQGEGLNDPYNSIHLVIDITGSPCDSTNALDRFNISDEVHQTFSLAALMAGKAVTIQPTGTCNSAGIEMINFIIIKSSD